MRNKKVKKLKIRGIFIIISLMFLCCLGFMIAIAHWERTEIQCVAFFTIFLMAYFHVMEVIRLDAMIAEERGIPTGKGIFQRIQ